MEENKNCSDEECDCGCGCETACECGCEDNPDIITLTEEDGTETDFVIIEGLEHNGTFYLALVEADKAEAEEMEFIILKNTSDGDEDALVSIDDEAEFKTVMKLFDAKIDNAGLFEFEEVEDEETPEN